MKQIDRVYICSSVTHEKFLVPDSNVYAVAEPQLFFQAYRACGKILPPSFVKQSLLYSHETKDEVLILLIHRLANPGAPAQSVTASFKVWMAQLSDRILCILRDFLGSLSVRNVLANITMVAEIIDCIFIGGFTHLMDAERIRGHISHTYTEPDKPMPSGSAHSIQSLTSSLYDTIIGSKSTPSYAERLVKLPPPASAPAPSTPSIVSSGSGDNSIHRDEIYIDMVEKVDIVPSSGDSGRSALCVINGEQTVKVKSSNSKKMSIQLNERHNSVTGTGRFADCTQTAKLSQTGSYSATAPVGSTKLISYSLQLDRLPLNVNITRGKGAGEMKLTLSSGLPAGVICLNTKVYFTQPTALRSVLMVAGIPSHQVELMDDKLSLVWTIPKLSGLTDVTAHVKLLSESQDEVSIPASIHVQLDFEISDYLLSGVKIRSVSVEKAKKWIRHITVSGCCALNVQIQ